MLPRIPCSFDIPCQVLDPEIWFPIAENDLRSPAVQGAKALCAECPVTAACLQLAFDTNSFSGIWGGLTAEERIAMRNAPRGAAASHTPRRYRCPQCMTRQNVKVDGTLGYHVHKGETCGGHGAKVTAALGAAAAVAPGELAGARA